MLAINRTTVINRKAPLNRGLLRWWLCLPKKHGGNRWRELTWKSDASITGATAIGALLRPGGYGCYSYDGTNDGAQTAAQDLSTVTTLTVALWLYWDAYAADNNLALERGNSSASYQGGFSLNPNYSAGGVASIQMFTGAASYSGVTFARPSAAAWHHYVFTLNRNAGSQQVTSVYIDGISVALTPENTSSTSTGGFGNWQWNFMSRNNGASLQAAGKLDDVRVYNRILSASEAHQLYRASRSGYKRELNRQRQVYPGIWEDSAPATPTTRQSTFPYHYRQRRRRRRGIA